MRYCEIKTITTPSESRRLHPYSLLFSLAGAGRSLLLPSAMLYFVRQGSGGYEFYLMLLFIPAALVSITKYITTRYRFDEEELVVRQGVLVRNVRHIPYSRIQNIDMVQNLFHRLLGVATARLQTASGSQAEANLQVISLSAVKELRTRILKPGSITEDPEQALEDPVVYQLRLADIALLGLFSARGQIIIAGLIGFGYELDLFTKYGEIVTNFLQETFDLEHLGTLETGLLIFSAVVLGICVAQLLSMSWMLLRFYQFRLRKSSQGLATESGLFTRVSASIPIHRIQVITIKAGFLLRLLQRVSVKAHSAGRIGSSDSPLHQEWLAPVLKRDELPNFLLMIRSNLFIEELDWQPIHPKARRRLIRKWLLLGFAVIGGLVFYEEWLWSAVAATVFPIGMLVIYWDLKSRAFARHHNLFAYRHGWLVKKWSLTTVDKIQSIERVASPFDRRWKMATLLVDTAGGGSSSERFTMPYMRTEDAETLFAELSTAAASQQFCW